ALTPSAEVNRLALRQLQGAFGSDHLYHVATQGGAREERDPQMPGRPLFGGETLEALVQALRAGARIRATRLTEQFGAEQYTARNPAARPLFVALPDGALHVVADRLP